MNKDIRDYLHLYHPQSGLKLQLSDGRIGVYEGITSSMIVKVFVDGGIIDEYINYVKPILRPLSDIKISDSVEIVESHPNMVVSNCYIFITNWVEGKGILIHFDTQVSFINKMRRMGFDCDGLIEAGLAIDKTTILS